MQYRGALLREERDVVREYTAMHDENFRSRWLREDLVGKEERRKEDKKLGEEVKKKGKREEEQKREGEKEKNEMVRVKRRCVDSTVTPAIADRSEGFFSMFFRFFHFLHFDNFFHFLLFIFFFIFFHFLPTSPP